MIVLACPLCGIGSGEVLFFLLMGLFLCMFAATALMFWGSWKDGDWHKDRARWGAIRAEYADCVETEMKESKGA